MLPNDVYPVVRVSTEYYLRGFDLLSRLQGDMMRSLVFMTVVHGQLTAPSGKPPSVRVLSRTLDVPYETVRRHVVELLHGGQFIEQAGGLVVPTKVQNSRLVSTFLRGIHGHAVRFLIALKSIKVARYRKKSSRPSSGKVAKEQLAIALAGTATLLAGIRALRDFWKGDIVRGLVYTAIWTANVKHVANTATAGTRDVLADKHRVPVTAFAISTGIRLPYETVRRHVRSLMDEDIVVRVARAGLIVPEKIHRRWEVGALMGYRLTMDFLAELRAAGVKV